jgi:hypothetical protein
MIPLPVDVLPKLSLGALKEKEVNIPEWATYVAVDYWGAVIVFENKPWQHNSTSWECGGRSMPLRAVFDASACSSVSP